MNWEQITAWLDSFTDKPIVYITECVIVGIIGALVVLSKTSLGRKAIIKLTGLYNLGEQKAKDTLEKVKEVELLAKEKIEALEAQYAQKTEELKADYEQKACALISIVNYYEESLFSLADKIPNAKVKAQLDELKTEYQEKKAQITDVVGIIYQDYTSALETSKDEIHKEYDEKIAFLSDEIKRLSLYISEIKEETENGQREEAENSDPIEEEIQGN